MFCLTLPIVIVKPGEMFEWKLPPYGDFRIQRLSGSGDRIALTFYPNEQQAQGPTPEASQEEVEHAGDAPAGDQGV